MVLSFIIGIAPSCMITFASDLYAGRAGDRTITKDCEVLQLLVDGDSVRTDKGSHITRYKPKNTALAFPIFERSPYLLKKRQIRLIAAVHVHVERARGE